MAKKEVVEENIIDSNDVFDGMSLDLEEIQNTEIPMVAVEKDDTPQRVQSVKRAERNISDLQLINPLTNTNVEVRYINKMNRDITDPKHILYGGLAEGSSITLVVPKLRSGTFVNVLTDNEKEYLEAAMGLEVGAMNVYNKDNNFWDNTTEGSVSSVRISKHGLVLHLNDPIDYIKYKILLANKDIVAPNLQTLQDKPKATYRFVLVADNDVNTTTRMNMSYKKQSYMEYGKIEDNKEVLRIVVETITGKPLAKNTKLDFLQGKVGELIEADAKTFLNVVKDPLLPTKILINQSIESGLISKRGNYLYLRSDNSPLCENGEEPTLNIAAKYLSSPKRQELKFSLEAKLKTE